MNVLREARAYASRGEYARALEGYHWFHNEGLQHDPSVYGVRRSFALSYWKELADKYPPALTALELIRDKKTAALRNGLADRELFADVSAINEYLGQIDRTSLLFTAIAEQDEKFAAKCFPSARPFLVRSREFALARRFFKSPKEVLEGLAARLNRTLSGCSRPNVELSRELQSVNIEIYIEDVQSLFEILIGSGEGNEIEDLRCRAIESVDDPSAKEKVRSRFETWNSPN